jgi:WD40 repeat protein
VRTLAGHKGWVRSVGFSPDNKEVVSASADKKVILWNLEEITKYKKPNNLLIAGCALLKNYLINNKENGNKEHNNNICENAGE